MNPLTRMNLLLSFLYLFLGSSLGLILSIRQTFPSIVHAHIQLIGFVTQMIIGVTYHVVPMLSRSKIYSFNLGYLHTILLNVGLLTQVYGFLTNSLFFKNFGSLLLFISVAMYLFNILKSMNWR